MLRYMIGHWIAYTNSIILVTSADPAAIRAQKTLCQKGYSYQTLCTWEAQLPSLRGNRFVSKPRDRIIRCECRWYGFRILSIDAVDHELVAARFQTERGSDTHMNILVDCDGTWFIIAVLAWIVEGADAISLRRTAIANYHKKTCMHGEMVRLG